MGVAYNSLYIFTTTATITTMITAAGAAALFYFHAFCVPQI